MSVITDKLSKIWFVGLFLLFVICLVVGFSNIYLSKNYQIIVEVSCDPNIEKCFVRDCSIEGNCPPNNLSVYKQYTGNAQKLDGCSLNGACEQVCRSRNICESVICDETAGDECLQTSGQTE